MKTKKKDKRGIQKAILAELSATKAAAASNRVKLSKAMKRGSSWDGK